MSYQCILLEREGCIARITLNRPDKLNALNSQLMDELYQAMDGLEQDENVRVVVITGGEKNFAAGADVTEVAQVKDSREGYEFACQRGRIYDKVYYFPQPVIAEVSGYALGGGCELALACDLRVASETARFGLPEITLGLLPGAGIQRLVRIVGPAAAKDMLFTGRQVGAEEALRIGLANKVVPADQLLAETQKLAEKLAGLPAYALKTIKTVVNKGTEIDLWTAVEMERQGFGLLFSTYDMREGVGAFLEKRKPQFQGK
ncbi:MAG: enoyl-CoA hydratase/isomerase family protein [Clostridia bacterium]|nr:MAG: enoyl-CoA hydratase/isomerase family protein [Clostridia bacterium]